MKKFILILLIFPFLLYSDINISQMENTSILSKSRILITDINSTFETINKQQFKKYNKNHINLGAVKKALWIQFTLINNSNKTINKTLVISSPLIEKTALYSDKKEISSILSAYKKFLYHTFNISLKAKENKTFYLKTVSQYSMIDFSLYLKNPALQAKKERNELFQDFFFLGIISALMLFSILIALYMKDISFIFYGLYLFAIIWQQLGYTGINRFILNKDLLLFDLHISSMKIAFLIITGSVFAISFLQLIYFPKLLKLYIALIIIAFLECFLKQNSSVGIYAPILTGAVFIIMNLSNSVYVYIKGIKEARFYILGFSTVFIAYSFMILDAFGIISIMEKQHNFLLIASSIEALILLLAFADRYIILKRQKEELQDKLLAEIKNKHREIKEEVERKTQELSLALEEKELLLRELNHRVKNNLQIILSMINLQKGTLKTEHGKSSCEKIEQRISAIAHTYNSLVTGNQFKNVNMSIYLKNILKDLEYFFNNPNIKIESDINLTLPLKEAVYIGIITNELITNSFKYAFKNQNKGTIKIKLYKQNGKKILEVLDDGIGFEESQKKDSLGLKLIYMLAKNQLRGKIIFDTQNGTYCKIIWENV